VTVNFSDPEDKALFTTASKVFSILMIGVQASAYLFGGVYGTMDTGTAVIIFLQLLCAGFVLMLLDEMIQKGWGIGSGISLFILAGVTQRVVWDSLALTPPWEDGKSWGAFIAFFQTLANRESLVNAFIRVDSGGNMLDRPSLLGFVVTLTVFVIVIYIEGIRVDIPISYARYRGFRGKYPIKLLYVSNLPVIFASTLFANIFFFSQLLWSRLGQPPPGTNFWLDLFGQYVVTGGQPQVIGGLAYYVTSPRNISAVLADPWRAIAFAGIMVAFSIVFSRTWLEVGGSNPRSVANQLVESGMQIPGFRRSGRSIELVLKRYIPVVAVLGGAIIGLIAAVADFFGVFGTGMGILLAVGILYQYYQLLMQEQVAEMYPTFGRVLGG
jgi:preprotein translocase subunit SecY/protein transport protein SEC61 subunit alpha